MNTPTVRRRVLDRIAVAGIAILLAGIPVDAITAGEGPRLRALPEDLVVRRWDPARLESLDLPGRMRELETADRPGALRLLQSVAPTR